MILHLWFFCRVGPPFFQSHGLVILEEPWHRWFCDDWHYSHGQTVLGSSWSLAPLYGQDLRRWQGWWIERFHAYAACTKKEALVCTVCIEYHSIPAWSYMQSNTWIYMVHANSQHILLQFPFDLSACSDLPDLPKGGLSRSRVESDFLQAWPHRGWADYLLGWCI